MVVQYLGIIEGQRLGGDIEDIKDIPGRSGRWQVLAYGGAKKERNSRRVPFAFHYGRPVHRLCLAVAFRLASWLIQG